MIKTKYILCFLIVFFNSFNVFSQDNTALIIIDMQAFFAEREGRLDPGRMVRWEQALQENQAKLNAVLSHQEKLIQEAMDQGILIVFVKDGYIGVMDWYLRRNGIGEDPREVSSSEIYRRLTSLTEDYDRVINFSKPHNGMFTGDTGLLDILTQHQIKDLVLVGANGPACVKCSIEDALQERFRVFIDPEGIISFDTHGAYRRFYYPYRWGDESIRTWNESFPGEIVQAESIDDTVAVLRGLSPFSNRISTSSMSSSCRKLFTR